MLQISRLAFTTAFSVAIFGALFARAQVAVPKNAGYGPIQAGRDAHAYHEQIRLWEVNRQLALQDELRWRAAWPAGSTYFSFPGVGFAGVGAYGTVGSAHIEALGRSGVTLRFSRRPYLPSRMFGYRVYGGVPQSIGQVQLQTGPNRWESHPVYPGMPVPTGHFAAPGRASSAPPAAAAVVPVPGSPPAATAPPAAAADLGPEPPTPDEPLDRGPVEF